MSHVMISLLATIDDPRARGLYNKVRAASNLTRPPGSPLFPLLEEWQGMSAFCDNFPCRLVCLLSRGVEGLLFVGGAHLGLLQRSTVVLSFSTPFRFGFLGRTKVSRFINVQNLNGLVATDRTLRSRQRDDNAARNGLLFTVHPSIRCQVHRKLFSCEDVASQFLSERRGRGCGTLGWSHGYLSGSGLSSNHGRI